VEIADATTSACSARGTDLTTVELDVAGMHCQSCVALIEETLVRDPRVARVTVDLDRGRASVAFDRGAISVDELCATVTGAGYTATPIASPNPTS
jgi:copper chaperone CopZ